MALDIKNKINVRRLTTYFGAEVTGIDLSQDLNDEEIAVIREILLENKVLFFIGQNLDTDSQVRFASKFGPLTSSHPVVPAVDEEHSEVWQIDSQMDVRNDQWHTDVTFVPRPPLGSVLRAIQVPEFGGDTSWGDLEAAYESLSAPIKALVDGLTAYHDGSREFSGILERQAGQGNMWDGEVFKGFTLVEHPVVRVHPETGRKALFVNPGFTVSIKGLSEFESRSLLEALYAHITKPEHLIRHHWTAGDIAMWDNRNTVHYANFDYGNFHRIMQRVTIQGDVPVGPKN